MLLEFGWKCFDPIDIKVVENAKFCKWKYPIIIIIINNSNTLDLKFRKCLQEGKPEGESSILSYFLGDVFLIPSSSILNMLCPS